MTDRPKAWEAHRLEQLRGWAGLSAAQRLAWLWQAKLFARRAVAAAQRRNPGSGS